jgi:Ca-activated chloride channel family protein
MSLGQPWFLALLVLPLLVYLLRRGGRRDATVLVGDAGSFGGLPATWRERLRSAPLILRLAALSLLAIAATRPMSEKVTERITSEGIDIMLALDVSDSMRALDFKPEDRIAVAKRVSTKFVMDRPGDRLGLVLFGTDAITQCPLTVDHEVLAQLIGQAEPAMLGGSTAIGMGLASAINRLRGAPGKSRVIILLTDGANNAGKIDPVTAARLAKSLGIKIYAIGVGKPGPALVPVKGPFGTRMVQIPDELDEKALQQVAAEGGGKYYRATDAAGMAHIFAEIDQLERTKVEREKASHFQDKYEPVLWFGFALLLLELLLAVGPLRKAA